MQRITRSRSILKRLRVRGIGSVIWGLIAIGVGANAMQVNPINGILLALGIFLVAEGAWKAFAADPSWFEGRRGCASPARHMGNIAEHDNEHSGWPPEHYSGNYGNCADQIGSQKLLNL